MAKPRKLKKTSRRLTELLNISELTAVGGDEHDIDAMSPDTALPSCVVCDGEVENHGRYDRTLIDVISVDGYKQFVRLHYYFYKYRCLNPACGAIFQKPVSFAKENSKTTKRYEDEIMRHLMYESMDKTREDLRDYIVAENDEDLISKPAMSKVVKRWVKDKDDSRKFITPAGVIIYTFESHYRSYMVICEFGERPLSVVEVFPYISASGIRDYFSRVEIEYIWSVIIDCNPIVYETVKELFPPGKIMVDTDALKQVLTDDYENCVFERAKKYSKEIRKNLCKTGVILEQEDAAKLYRIRNNDEVLGSAFKKYASLYTLLKDHQDVLDIMPWKDYLSDDDKEVFTLTILYIETYWSEIMNYYKRRTNVSGSTYEMLYELNQKIDNYFLQCTDDVFRARLLYSKFEDISNKVWHGIPVSELKDLLDDMITEGGLEKHEHKRR